MSPRTLVLLAFLLMLPSTAFAQEGSDSEVEAATPESPEATAAEAESSEEALPSWCAAREGEPLQVIAAYDGGKYFQRVEPAAQRATRDMVDALCPGDTVRMATYHTGVEWLGESVLVHDDASRDGLVRQLRKRNPPESGNSINHNLVKGAFDEWDRVGVADEGLLALVVFTDTMHSDAPSRGYYTDYAWDNLPAFLRGRLLVIIAQHDIRIPDAEPIYHVSSAPPGFHLTDFPSGRGTTFEDILQGFDREPPPVLPTASAEASEEQTAPAPVAPPAPASAVEPTGLDAWTAVLSSLPGLVLSGLVLVLILALAFALGRRGRPRRRGAVEEGAAGAALEDGPDITLLLRDRFSGSVLKEETRALADALKVGSGREVDFYVPGPYAFEILATHGGKPSVRSANLLGVEIVRPGGRRQAITDSDLIPIHSGDRFDLGGGHEIEVRLNGA